MTAIVAPEVFTSKAALKAVAESGTLTITEPSPHGFRSFNARDMKPGESVVVTNHPLRTRFAKLMRTADGFRVV